MYKQILIATDGSELAQKGLEQGLRMAVVMNANVIILTASEPWQPVDVGQVWGGSASMLEDYRKQVADASQRVLAEAGKRAAELGVPHQPLYVADRFPSDAILDAVKEHNVDLIVMATHGRRGFNRLLIGSQTNTVITHSTIPVLVVR